VLFALFQMKFAIITPSLITGSFAERVRFSAYMFFMMFFFFIIYCPLAHMTWHPEGLFMKWGVIDFAGGIVVHASSGIAALAGAIFLGRRKAETRKSEPANVTFVLLGAAMLWLGWFGFNAGSQFAADGVAALALLNTIVASAAGMASWMIVERARVGKPTLVGACTGLVAGLVAITPAAGFVEPWAAIVMGIVTAPCCFFAISFAKRRFGYDDALDAFGCHSIGGIVGGVLTGIFCVPELSWTDFGGLIYTGSPALLVSQILGILVTLAFVIVGGLVIGMAVKAAFGGSLHVNAADEAMGLDVASHGESAYPAFLGMD
jgi:Amt family ammonium transporter